MSRYTLVIASLFVVTLTICLIGEYTDIQQFETNQQQQITQ